MTKGVGVGTGLGLSVVHGIVKTHQGAVKIQSAPGKGTTVAVYLPIATTPLQVKLPGAERGAVQGDGQHVLYVDDDGALVRLVGRVMTRLGYRISCYLSGNDAVDAVRSAPTDFDMIVTDFNMPGLSGLDVARAVRSFRADLPVVIFSGYVTEQLRSDALDAGVSEVITKASTVDEMCRTIDRLLSKNKN